MGCLMEMHFSPPQARILNVERPAAGGFFLGFWFQIVGIPLKIIGFGSTNEKISACGGQIITKRL